MSNQAPYQVGELITLGSSAGFYRNTYGIILDGGELIKEPYYRGGSIGDGYWYFDVLMYDGSVQRVRQELIFEYSPEISAFQQSLQGDFGAVARRQHANSQNILLAHKAISTPANALANMKISA